ncbi:MAG: DUF3093 domain-containing protein [Leucobacter sp.]
MATDTSTNVSASRYRERLIPGPGLYIALLLLAPAVALITLPIEPPASIPAGISAYVIVALILTLLSPVIVVSEGRFTAGRATIPIDQLGEIELLGAEGMRAAIGPGVDARNYLLLRGWIHRGVRIQNIDPADPAPYWVITTRHPQRLAEAIEASRVRG